MQDNSFIPQGPLTIPEFWEGTNTLAKKHNMDCVLAYMKFMLEYNDGKIHKSKLFKYGQDVTLFPGLAENTNWFDNLNIHIKDNPKFEIQHFIISSAIEDMIIGSPIYKRFNYIFASAFFYDDNDYAIFPARSVNYTTKTQYLFRINKGIFNSWDNEKLNEYTPKHKRSIPFNQMIYIGDGDTDVPAMKMINYKGGYSIVVYPSGDEKKMKTAKKLVKNDRAKYCVEANYTKDSKLYNIVTKLINRIIDELETNMNQEAI